MALRVPLPLVTDCLGFGPIPVRELPQPAAPVVGLKAMAVFLGSHLPWQHLDTGEMRQGRKHPGRGLRGPCGVAQVTPPPSVEGRGPGAPWTDGTTT